MIKHPQPSGIFVSHGRISSIDKCKGRGRQGKREKGISIYKYKPSGQFPLLSSSLYWMPIVAANPLRTVSPLGCLLLLSTLLSFSGCFSTPSPFPVQSKPTRSCFDVSCTLSTPSPASAAIREGSFPRSELLKYAESWSINYERPGPGKFPAGC